jgi:dynein heavy chain
VYLDESALPLWQFDDDEMEPYLVLRSATAPSDPVSSIIAIAAAANNAATGNPSAEFSGPDPGAVVGASCRAPFFHAGGACDSLTTGLEGALDGDGPNAESTISNGHRWEWYPAIVRGYRLPPPPPNPYSPAPLLRAEDVEYLVEFQDPATVPPSSAPQPLEDDGVHNPLTGFDADAEGEGEDTGAAEGKEEGLRERAHGAGRPPVAAPIAVPARPLTSQTAFKPFTKAVHRVQMCFDGEDRLLFSHRLIKASARREKCKATLRFAAFVERLQLPVPQSGLQQAWLDRILQSALAYISGYAFGHGRYTRLKGLIVARQAAAKLANLGSRKAASIGALGVRRQRLQSSATDATGNDGYGNDDEGESQTAATDSRPNTPGLVPTAAVGVSDPAAALEAAAVDRSEIEAYALRKAAALIRMPQQQQSKGLYSFQGPNATRLAAPEKPSKLALAANAASAAAVAAGLGSIVDEQTLAAVAKEVVQDYDAYSKTTVVWRVLRASEVRGGPHLPLPGGGVVFSHALADWANKFRDEFPSLRLAPPPPLPMVPESGKYFSGANPASLPAALSVLRNASVHASQRELVELLRGIKTYWEEEWDHECFFTDEGLTDMELLRQFPASSMGNGSAAANLLAATLAGTLAGPDARSSRPRAGAQQATRNLPLSLSAFVSAQEAHCVKHSDRLLREWTREMVHMITEGVPKTAEFNVYDQSQEAYPRSRLRRLLRRVDLVMTDQLRDVGERTCDAIIALLSAYVKAEMAPETPNEPEEAEAASPEEDTIAADQEALADSAAATAAKDEDGDFAGAAPVRAVLDDKEVAAGAASGAEGEEGTVALPSRRRPEPTLKHAAIARKPLFEAKLVLKRAGGGDLNVPSLAMPSETLEAGGSALTGTASVFSSEAGGSLNFPLNDAGNVVSSVNVALSPAPKEIVAAFLQPVNSMAETISAVRSIENKVVSLLKLPDPRQLLPVGSTDPAFGGINFKIDSTRQWIEEILNEHLLVPGIEIASRFAPFAWLADADPKVAVARYMDAALAASRPKMQEAANANAGSAVGKKKGRHVSMAPMGDEFNADMGDGDEKSPGGSKSLLAAVNAAPPLAKRLPVMPEAPDSDVLFSGVTRFHEAAEGVKAAAADIETAGLLLVQGAQVKSTLISRATKVRDALIAAVLSGARASAEVVGQQYQAVIGHISRRPRDEAELLDVMKCMDGVPEVAQALEVRTEDIHSRLSRCGDYSYLVPQDDVSLAWSLKLWPMRLHHALAEAHEALRMDSLSMADALEAQKQRFVAEIDALSRRIEGFKAISMNDPQTELTPIVTSASDLDGELRAAMEQATDINAREAGLGIATTSYSILNELQDSYEPFLKLWTALGDFVGKKDTWNSTGILEVNAQEIEKDVNEWWTLSYRLMKALGDHYPGAHAAARLLRGLTDDFRKNVPLIRCLASKALETRHWRAISKKINRPLDPQEEDVTLKDLLDSGLLSLFDDIEEIASTAEKEFSLKKALANMRKEWDTVKFDVHAYKETGTYVLRGTDDINQLLDDQIVKTQTMLGSPYIKPHMDECQKWERTLVTVQAVLEEWLLVQRTWLYLEPIFSSEDIMRQMPQEGRRFGTVDKLFRKTMQDTFENPKALEAAGKDKMLEKLREANKLLDMIQKGLNDYLEVKRLAFPRFFFLSNDELLEILSETKDPTRVQPHLGKCFEGIARVQFRGQLDQPGVSKDDVTITHMVSAENELVPMVATIDPNSAKNKGNVEVWLLELQKVMRLTLKDVIKKASAAYVTAPRKEWVLSWPGQVVLNVSQVFWTREVEDALQRGGNEGLKEYEKVLNDQLQDIVQLVRGKLDRLQRTTLGALCVIDVHARDVISDMAQKGVSNASEFDWTAQLRYYWEHHPDDYNRYGDDPNNLMVKIINSGIIYGYEYLGNSSRLVITPLTDRCYRTLMSAVGLMYGGAPAGPAGTGKTETTKDLSKAVAIQCVVFNCSDGLDYLAMAKFFKGLASAGAWACFDEFNRIELEVLSVIAQQVLTIQKAKRGRVTKFNFEGTTLSLNPDVSIFITMNPGYAGRSELPENLKALFRPCAMMVPDYALIAEIKLYSFGFADARNMARKLTQVLRLASEQLSSQKHYDYGMRAVFSILMRCGSLRMSMGHIWSEELVVLQSILDVNVPKFTTNDLPLFRGIVSDLFPGVAVPTPDYSVLHRAVKLACRAMNIQPKDEFIKSVTQLYETVQVRHGLMVVGETGCGKTRVVRCLAHAMTSLAGQADYVPVHIHAMNPKSITQGQLYGTFDENTHEWADGVLALTYRSCARDTTQDRHWIMFDGPVDAVWIENMNTVLDDNKKLCLNSGEIIKMSSQMTMMFETDSLAEASPATVSRVGMVYMEPRRLGWRPLLQSWIKTLPRALSRKGRQEQLIALFEWLIPPCLQFVNNFVKVITPVTDLHLVSALISLYDCLLAKPFGRRQQAQANAFLATSSASSANAPVASEEGSSAGKRVTTEDGADDVDDIVDVDEDEDDDARQSRPMTAAGCEPQPSEVDVPAAIEGLFLMSLIWSVGTVVDAKGRAAFSDYLMMLLSATAVDDPRFQDFKIKAPMYDGHFVGGGLAARAADGDVRDRDYDDLTGASAEEKPAHASGNKPKAAPGEEETASRFFIEPMTTGALRTSAFGPPLDERTTVFDFNFLSVGGGQYTWRPWSASLPDFKAADGASFTDLIVPTVDIVRNTWLLDLLMNNGRHVLCVGDTGTGKSVTLQEKLMSGMNPDLYSPVMVTFSAQTSANATQDIIDAKMSRRRKGVFGPPLGHKFIVFVDDLNMPSKETYGAQPPIELLRQWMDHNGWYDRRDKEKSFMEIVDVQFVAAMGPPGGGRTRITQRYVRHYNVLGFVPFDNHSLERVFNAIMGWSTVKHAEPIKAILPSVVSATVDLYSTVLNELLPTPMKSHYTFNLRDLSRVFLGMHQAPPMNVPAVNSYIRLWAHECARVFQDRLVSDEDRLWFTNAISSQVAKHFSGASWDAIARENPTVVEPVGTLAVPPLWANFVDTKLNLYMEVRDIPQLVQTMTLQLEDYNATSSRPMNLVLARYAVEHICRISRIITQPLGNALLVGVGGSGRKSLCYLATFMAGYQLTSIEISKSYGNNEWKDDLKRILTMAGKDGKQTVFLLSDTQIVKESFLEDVSNLLNKGDVPNLFAPDERAVLIGDMQMVAKRQQRVLRNANDAFAYFTERVRANLHVVLCLSPIGDAFRTRLRMFPSLVNCTCIDWFSAWPDEALRSVAKFLLEPVEVPGPASIKDSVVDVCVDMQMRVTQLSHRYLQEARRHYYVTPTSYLELLSTFKTLLGSKSEELLGAKARYENGLDKLAATETQVAGMQEELIALQPKLKVASEETEAMIVRIEVVKEDVGKKAEIVAVEERACGEQAAAAQAIKDDCESQLAEAIPALNAAVKAVAGLNKSDIVEVKSLRKPPDGVKLTMEAVCILFGFTPKKVPNPSGKGKIDDYWEVAQKDLLGDSHMVDKLKSFDADNIPPVITEKIAPYVAREDFQIELVSRVSVAAGGLCKWVHAIVKYDRVARVVAPKRAALAEATAALEAARVLLEGKQAELGTLRAQLQKLQNELQDAMTKKDKLAKDVQDCAARLDRAQRLIGGLGSEKTRWMATVKTLEEQHQSVVGDVLLSSGVIAYLGAFTAAYRESCCSEWLALLKSKHIPASALNPPAHGHQHEAPAGGAHKGKDNANASATAAAAAGGAFKLASILGEAVRIRSWTLARLPNDSFSIDNAIMLFASARWPLCIDPQRQANRWIRNMETSNSLKVVRQNQGNFTRTIETALQFGNPILLENVPETLDPVLEPLLSRQIVKSGGVLTVRLGDSVVEYDPKFRLYITTVLPNPHYSPETCVKVNLLNFMATQEGLYDQMLGLVVKLERPDLEEQREKLVLADAENKRQLKELEDKILSLLAAAKGNILDDEVLISTLSESKETSNQIQRQVEIAERTQVKINATRAGYAPVAKRASLLFFTVADMAQVDPMYQFSLAWYTRLFVLAVEKAPKPDAAAQQTPASLLEKRLDSLKETFTTFLYENVCRSLFDRHKLLFSSLLCFKILLGDSKLDAGELRYFLQGSLAMTPRRPNPSVPKGADGKPIPDKAGWIPEKSWIDLLDLSHYLPGFRNFDVGFESNVRQWASVAESQDPAVDIARLTADMNFTLFQRLLILRCLRPDKVIPALQAYITTELGRQYIDPPAFNLQRGFEDADSITPLVFVLSAGVDPMNELLKLAEKAGKAKKMASVSLGQGQGPVAERSIQEAIDQGGWVVLQNCHLATSWMPTLERIVEELRPEIVHEQFRMWLTSMPSPTFPVSILQNGVKMTLELPKGLRQGLQGALLSIDHEWFDGCSRPVEFKRLCFGLCFFHALVSERRKFGPLGWNIRYDFADSDLRISLDQLRLFFDDPAYASLLPFAALQYLTGECNYGGRVTDDMDRRLLATMLADVYREGVVAEDNCEIAQGANTSYLVPAGEGPLASYVDYVRGLPMTDAPEVFGLHDNADITVAINESGHMLGTALSLMPRNLGQLSVQPSSTEKGKGARPSSSTKTASGHAEAEKAAPAAAAAVNSADAMLSSLCADILTKLPEPFDLEKVEVLFPVSYENSLNTVLAQECGRFNNLLSVLRSTLADVQKAIRGTVVMSSELEAIGTAVSQGRVPSAWAAVAYPSVKPLGSWVVDLVDRLQFLQRWMDNGPPNVFWISGFFFTQSFLTGVRQNFARKYGIPIDETTYDFRVLNTQENLAVNAVAKGEKPPASAVDVSGQPISGASPADGAYINGLFLQGARWDANHGVLSDSKPRELFSVMPIIHLVPARTSDIDPDAFVYVCPVYKTSVRAGTLSTTGHSTTHVMNMSLAIHYESSPQYWTKRGTALLCQLDD